MAGSGYKWLILVVLATTLSSSGILRCHPLHVSVVEANHNGADKTLEISCKIFTDDFEKVLIKNYRAKVDLMNPPDKKPMDSLVKKYVLSHLSMKVNGQPVNFGYVGFEQEGEAVYCYIEVMNVPVLTRLEVSTNLMYDLFDDQMNIIHVSTNGNRKSFKIDYPSTTAVFNFQ